MFNLAKLRQKRADGDNGFTLIELLVVVVIIGILIAIAIPLYLNYKKGAADKSAQSDLRNAITTLETCNTDSSTYPVATFTVTTAAGTPCTSQTIKTSSGTTLTYYPATAVAGVSPSYLLVAFNSGGNVTGGSSGGYYCYASSAGGSLAKRTAAIPTAWANAC